MDLASWNSIGGLLVWLPILASAAMLFALRFLGYELGQGRPYSKETARRIDDAVQKLLEEPHQQVLDLLEKARDRLSRLTEALLDRETLEQDELERLLGPRPATVVRNEAAA